MTTVLVSEDSTGKRRWRQHFIVRDGGLTLMEMSPAVFGWNVHKVSEQGSDHWGGMSEASIVAWRMERGAQRASKEISEWVLDRLKNGTDSQGCNPL